MQERVLYNLEARRCFANRQEYLITSHRIYTYIKPQA